MKSLRDLLKDIERHSYNSAIEMVAHVRNNYEAVIVRKDKEIAELKSKLNTESNKCHK